MLRTALAFLLGALALGAQEAAYFKEPEPPWWRPAGLLLLEAERLPSLQNDYDADALRQRALLELGWTRSWSFITADLAVRGAAGSDGNALNLGRYDQRPSNGAWLQRASLRVEGLGEKGFASATFGLQANPLLSQESLWDHDLALTGLGLRAAWRDEGRGIVEAGVRAVTGRVRTFPNQAVDVHAVQAVLRLETGPLAWSLHADRWEIAWKPGDERFEPLRGSGEGARQRIRLNAAGLGMQGAFTLPVEGKVFAHRNPETGESGREVQAWIGPVARPFRPRVGFVHQRLAATGTAYAVGSDDWWFLDDARGSRFLVQLPLGRGLRLTFAELRHRWDGDPRTARRSTLSLEWRF